MRRNNLADWRRGCGSNVVIGFRRTFLYLEYSKAIGATICVYDRAPSQKSWPGEGAAGAGVGSGAALSAWAGAGDEGGGDKRV